MTASPNAAPTPPRATSPSGSRKYTNEEISKAIERLSRPHTPAATLDPLPLRDIRPLTPAQIQSSAERLCNHSVNMKQKTMDVLNRKFLVDPRPHKVLSKEDTEASVSRLFYSTIQTMEQKREKLRKRFLHPGAKVIKDNEKVQHAVAHLFTEEQARAKERQKKLSEKYIKSTEPKMLKVTQTEIGSIVERLAAGKK